MKHLFLIGCLFLFLVTARAQQARGRVISAADSTPLPGATVRLLGAATGTTTDQHGDFSLAGGQPGDTLRVSFVGFVPRDLLLREPPADGLVVALQPDERALQEVVVSTGYQRLPRERATGSFAQVESDQLREQVSTDLLSRLEAVASGVTVDRSGLQPQLVVRGLSTINGPRSPLVVVDNFPYEGDIANLNPNDVASVTVLKDAAAASIWGARAGNGVIVITTKKGRYSQPLAAEVNANVSVSREPDLSYLPQMNAADFIDVERLLFANNYYRSQLNSIGRPVLSPVVELLAAEQNGTLSAEAAAARLDALRAVDVRDDYARYVYQRAVRQQYALHLSSGSEVLAWSLSAGYDRNADALAAGYDRANLRFQNTLRPARGLSVSTSAYYTRSEAASGRPGYAQDGKAGTYLFPYARLADEAGNPLPLVRDYSQAYKDTAGGGRLLDWNLYPLEDFRHSRTTTSLQDLTANLGVDYSWRHGLSAAVKYQYERQQTDTRLLQDAGSYYARSLANFYTQRDPETGELTYAVPRGGILDQSHRLLASHNLRGQLNFDRTWARHALAVIAGTELRHARTTGDRSRLYGYDPGNLTFGNVDYTARYPNFIFGRSSFLPNPAEVDSRLTRYVSQYANAAYTLLDRYTLSVSGRRDASNLFGLRTNDLWNPLWSSGLGWELSKEGFYKLRFLPYLRLRGTYGVSGNTNPAMTAVTTLSFLGTSPFTETPYARFSTYANPDLAWETVALWNVGLDFHLKGDRLGGSLEYYRKRARNLFGTAPVDYTAGVGSELTSNVAAMRGRGVDVALQSVNLQGALRWTTQLNASYAADEVTDYYLSSTQGSNFITSAQLVSGIPGKPVYAVYSYRWAGLDPQTGDPRGYVNGEPSSDYGTLVGPDTELGELRYHGSALPTVFGSLGNTLSWRGLSLTARVSWKLGYSFRDRSIDYGTLFANWGGHADFAQRWQQPGDETRTHVPSLVYPNSSLRDTFYAGSEVLVQRGDHVRLQYLQAAYELRPGRAGAARRSLQVYLNLSDVGILWRANDRGLDPDVARAVNGLPAPLTASLGLRANL